MVKAGKALIAGLLGGVVGAATMTGVITTTSLVGDPIVRERRAFIAYCREKVDALGLLWPTASKIAKELIDGPGFGIGMEPYEAVDCGWAVTAPERFALVGADGWRQ